MFALELVCRYPIRRGTQADRDVCGATATYSDLTPTGAAFAAAMDGWAVDPVIVGTSTREDYCPEHYGRQARPPLPAAERAAYEHREALHRRRAATQSAAVTQSVPAV